ncbi:MAG TPA: transposase [Pseudonocardiaceae bacterium]|nr:transposase [Pseudonocardiaceae bacterium]
MTRVLATFRPCFTAPTFETFTMMVAGLVAQPVRRTVCGMLTGAGLAQVWHHGRAHRFFSHARWNSQQVGLLLAELIVARLMAAGAPITVAIDDTLFRRRGRKVHAVGWFHDGSAAGGVKLGFGNNWVVAAIIVTLPFLSRPVALPVLAALAVKGGASKPDLARDLVDLIAERFADREIHVVADAAYGCGAFMGLGDGMTMTTRAKANAVFSQMAPPRTGKRGRPKLKGERIGTPADISASATWRTVTVFRYGTTNTVQIAEQTCLWYGTWRTDPVRVILVRDTNKTITGNGYDIALATTDLTATAEEIIARYATRWSIEVTFFDVKNILGIGQARNRTKKAVERTVPFGLFCHSILIIWYALHGHDSTDTGQRRSSAPWYRSKTEPATLDMLTKLRRKIIAARFMPPSPRPATTQEIIEVQQAWAHAAA